MRPTSTQPHERHDPDGHALPVWWPRARRTSPSRPPQSATPAIRAICS